ncbi:hypothetical protein OCS_04701 [Ophiocordyceps sinensis CO18]|uniref:Calcineurin-like phosphoesterase domain-containing protein n=1 Tax=Ophiocordyceps sinensis (strain Co18 / CGMCC 3.14243) TaxID=911162 RepID=T5A2D7_OPHSC|nr:hypothetical protein OCS_04701 [Ophiocordyceps sinensis CO18]
MPSLLKALARRLRSSHRLRLQVMSDLHLEAPRLRRIPRLPPRAGPSLPKGVSGAGKPRVLRLWPLDAARRLSREPSLADTVVVLNKTRWDDPDSNLTILGCTLWSAISDEARGVVEAKVNDFKKMGAWTARKHNEVHADEVAWLRHQVSLARGRLLLVATHHAPCLEGTSQPGHSDNPWSSAFATDLLAQEGWGGVSVWVFGHTHYSTDFSLPSGIRLVANQRGYVLPCMTDGSRTNKGGHDFDAAMSITMGS